MARIGVDVGGTNTDLILETTEHDSIGSGIFEHKVPSTTDDQSIGVIQGILALCKKANLPPAEVELIVHGTTVATNISIEHNGAEVGMLTTRGFRDILHIGRHKRPHNFSLQFDVPWQSRPLVKRRNRIPITERILPPDGRIEAQLDEQEVRQAAELLRDRGINSVIIGFLFSFLNNAHEQRAKEIVKEVMPDAHVCCSSEVVDVMREFERFSTAAMSAYIAPKTAYYLKRLVSRLQENGITAELRVMQSNGGVATVGQCIERPVGMLMSGPAGGVIGGQYFASLDNEQNVITVDIGGTSADISTLVAGQFKMMNPRDATVADYPVMAPMIDMLTIGAGGGSVAYIDAAGGFHVGPRSAGSMPGPACYNRGGTEPTVTDANVVLGRLDPDRMLGGDLAIDATLSHRAIEEKIAGPLGMTVTEAALGILRIVNNNMALAIRSASVARGLDPREFVLMPFGGAGPVHGPALAEEIRAKAVFVPPIPGIAAAAGLLATDMKYELTRSVLRELTKIDASGLAEINKAFQILEEESRVRLGDDGVSPADMLLHRIAECRYHGQGFELRAAVPAGEITADNVGEIIDSFHDQHETDYGYRFADDAVELVSVRVIAEAKSRHLAWPQAEEGSVESTEAVILYERDTTFDDGRTLSTPRYDRTKLRAGQVIDGPALLMQHDSTLLVPPGWNAAVTRHGNIYIAQKSSSQPIVSQSAQSAREVETAIMG